ncbi:sure-like protein [Laetiporus sulphureus 93-53]|uniref:Sure-like protein n=1 Tax=Laetiporus sulphureus 93-53 TaxID=1314785 RepID=A0A165DP19_9APHY|nr:sure-like protein [Laetiporus sulphureus 93-53]KZT05308.1 sure-like protein [Laetiporus sulphureus 93-53]
MRVSVSFISIALSTVFVAHAKNIILTNDDGWADAQIRAQYTDLTDADFDVVLSCPAQNESGTGSSTATPTVLTEPCEYDTCPIGSPPEGYNASDPRLNYVNSYPVDAVHYGFQTLAPKFFHGSKPDFVVSGPNIGNNLGTVVLISGTVGAACEAAKEGIPATAFSGDTGAQVSYTTLESDPTASSSESSWIYSALTVHYTKTILAVDFPGIPLLPSNVIVSVNYPAIDDCPDPADYKWVFSRNLASDDAEDLWTCGSTTLPAESDVVAASGCYSSVTVLNAINKTDVDALTQAEVYVRLAALPFSCLPS